MLYNNLPASHNAFRVFESVARLMSFTKAANELHVTQSAVSRQVKQLEDELNVSLLVRNHRSIELTQQGKELFDVLRDNYQSLDSLIGRWKQPDKQRIVIKSALSFTTRVLLPKVAMLNERYPDHEIVIMPSIEEDPDLDSEDCDLLIINTRKPHLYVSRRDVVFLRDEYMAPVYSETLSHNRINQKDVLSLPHLHATLDHRDWKVWLKNTGLDGIKTGRDTVFFSLDLALSACLSGQGVTVTDLLLVLPELNRQFLQCPQDIQLQYSDWQYYCYQGNRSEVTSEILAWLKSEVEKDIASLSQLCERFGWQNRQSESRTS